MLITRDVDPDYFIRWIKLILPGRTRSFYTQFWHTVVFVMLIMRNVEADHCTRRIQIILLGITRSFYPLDPDHLEIHLKIQNKLKRQSKKSNKNASDNMIAELRRHIFKLCNRTSKHLFCII